MLAIALALVVVVPVGLADAAGADSGGDLTFDATASGYGFDATIQNPSIPLGLTIEGTGPVAQSHLSSLGQSDGFASFPYPGDAVVGLPALVSGVLLPGYPIPPYPTYVHSAVGAPTIGSSYPGINLDSTSNQNDSNAEASVGTQASGYDSTSSVVYDTSQDTVTATGKTMINDISLGTSATLSDVESDATAVLSSDGTVKLTSNLSIGHFIAPALNLTIPTSTPANPPVPVPIPGVPSFNLPLPAIPIPFGGQTIHDPNIGFVNGQFTITLPIGGTTTTFALPADSALSALKAAGFDVTYEDPIQTASAITAGALEIKFTVPAPPQNNYFNGATPIDYTFGRSHADIEGSVVPSAPDAATIPIAGGSSTGAIATTPGTTPSSGSTAPVTTGSTGGGAAAGVTGSTPAGAALTSGSDSSGSLGDGTSGAPSPDIAGQSGGAATATGSSPASGGLALARQAHPLSSAFNIYLVLVGVGLVGSIAGGVFRYGGVRASWRS